jgi:hypothetical protein
MEALSLALIAVHGHAVGQVTPVTLVDPAGGPPFYLHGISNWIAQFEDGVITWRREISGSRPEAMR